MRAEEVPRVRIAVLGGDNVGKSGKLKTLFKCTLSFYQNHIAS